MKNSVIASLAGAAALALGMHAAIAANTQVNADSKMDQQSMQHTGASGTPTPGWEKLSKNKNWKPAAQGKAMPARHGASGMKSDSHVVPADGKHATKPGM